MRIIPIIFIIILYRNQVHAADTLNINDAVLRRKITVEVSGNGGLGIGSAHFSIKNYSATDLNIHIPAGIVLYSENPNVQDLIILSENFPLVKTRSTHQFDTYGACTQQSNHCPMERESYKLGQLAKKELVEIAQIIAKNNLQSSIGQSAVWAISNDQRFNSFDSNHIDASWDIAKIIAIYKKENPPAREEIQRWQRAENQIVFSARASMSYHAPKDIKAKLSILDSAGNEVKTVFDYKNIFAGLHIYTVGLNHLLAAESTFQAKLVSERNEVLKEFTLVNNQGFTEIKEKLQNIRFEFIVRKPSKITMSVYDSNGRLVQEIYKAKPLPLSKRNTNFKFIHAFETGEQFEIRMSDQDGVIIHTEKIKAI